MSDLKVSDLQAAADYSLHYRTWHNETPEHAQMMANGYKAILKGRIPEKAEGAAIDIGCGMGFMLLALQQLGYKDVVGIDVDPQQVAAARRAGLNAQVVEDSLAYLESRPGKFSLVTMFDVFEHIPVSCHIPMARAIYNALRPGGAFVLQVPNANSPVAARYRYIDHTHHCSFTEHSLSYVLRNASFSDIVIDGYSPALRPSLRIWRSDVRKHFTLSLKRWVVFKLWRWLYEVEIGPVDDLSRISFSPNVLCRAVRS
ncbi:Ubiquinone biosynthesis O-methyltransferase [Caulifigura coniformis]|uniref:Ubiquinone biosynthesis O-methyltransferase n=1 Tax=Caulifigura coniformis TaxID=2527983 RepID=A0A517SIA1_9PLAN|nr:class I SAM-dependent methyltransferase [Caulifigura coniformis]QDT55850.1 Ubiquinone biosynthesis O-methyltransferase [Caulifigura coniformis]